MKNEKGQSLTEFLVLVPVFFIILCGFIAIFQAKIRLDTDEHTKFVLGNSQAFFSQEERQNKNWSSADKDQNSVLKTDANLGFNPSEGFLYAEDKENGVYFDKKKINVKNSSTCSGGTEAAVQLSNDGSFTVQSCADASGYDTAQLEIADNSVTAIQGKLDFSGKSLFFSDFFEFSQRRENPKIAYNNFRQNSHNATDYFDDYAAITNDSQSNFTYDCLMNPWKSRWQAPTWGSPSSGNCQPYIPEKAFSKAASEIASWEEDFCYAEILASCGFINWICIGAQSTRMNIAIWTGNEPSVCPITNSSVKAGIAVAEAYLEGDLLYDRLDESARRTSIAPSF